MKKEAAVVLGAGITGLAAGLLYKLPVFEAKQIPGGMCASYCLHPKSRKKSYYPPRDEESYLFEIGGGHWIWGKDQIIQSFLSQFAEMKNYQRKSAVYFPDRELCVPYPIQYNLLYLGADVAQQISSEINDNLGKIHSCSTMDDWLKLNFGETLCDLFFFPFHDSYTAGLFKKVSPKDNYKTPTINIFTNVLRGDHDTKLKQASYNERFCYPVKGLGELVQNMAKVTDIKFGNNVISIEPSKRLISFSNGEEISYKHIISTLPLNRLMHLTGLKTQSKEDPYTSVLVINIGASRGKKCPNYHWLYVPKTHSGFYRIGYYSNVDEFFLPKSARLAKTKVSCYVEKAFIGGYKPSNSELRQLCNLAIQELQEWGVIEEVEVVDLTWIDVAYTWSWPEFSWVNECQKTLNEYGILSIGRYGRWTNQGIVDSVRDALTVKDSLKF